MGEVVKSIEDGCLRVWMMGLRIGLTSLPKEPVLGVKRLVLPISYWRTAEFAYVWRRLSRFPAGARVLDLGSPKDLAAMLARHRGYEVVATDILPEAIGLSRRYARAQGLGWQGCGPRLLRGARRSRSGLPGRFIRRGLLGFGAGTHSGAGRRFGDPRTDTYRQTGGRRGCDHALRP